MPAAARVTDMHVCTKSEPGPVPHVGGPTSGGAGTVFIGYQPAARVGDKLVCFGGPPDSISQGEGTVMIEGQPAARMGDPTSHGGHIVAGCPTVIIGSSTQALTIQVAAESATPICEDCEKAKRAAEKQAESDKVASEEKENVATMWAALAAGAAAAAGSVAAAAATTNFDEHFVLVDDRTGEPIRDREYQLETASGKVVKGVVGEDGKTNLARGNSPEGVTLHLGLQDKIVIG
jgi:uncharacterized Zn-binding protein involved in type VI secretion